MPQVSFVKGFPLSVAKLDEFLLSNDKAPTEGSRIWPADLKEISELFRARGVDCDINILRAERLGFDHAHHVYVCCDWVYVFAAKRVDRCLDKPIPAGFDEIRVSLGVDTEIGTFVVFNEEQEWAPEPLLSTEKRSLHAKSAEMQQNLGQIGKGTDKKSTALKRAHIHYQSTESKPNHLENLVKKDFFWIECKAPNKAAPFEWKDVVGETVRRLNSAHPDRELFVVLAIGLKWMYFAWDPLNSMSHSTQLFIKSSSGRTAPWKLDRRIKAFHDAPWVDTQTGEVRPSSAMSLDFWSTTKVGQESRILNWQGLELLEQFLHTVRSAALAGVNPAHF